MTIPQRIFPSVTACALAGCLAFAASGCYRASDEYLSKKEKGGSGEVEPENRTQGSGEPSGEDGPVSPSSEELLTMGSNAASDLLPGSGGEDGIRDLFASVELNEALPMLESELAAHPNDVTSLLRGAFAGVGNKTESCEEILLYLAIRHPELANQLAGVAAQVNPEIQSWRQ